MSAGLLPSPPTLSVALESSFQADEPCEEGVGDEEDDVVAQDMVAVHVIDVEVVVVDLGVA